MELQDRAYRPDINGLRAIAVLAVLLFHFKLPGFEGGFAGVDVFFVISGYLMTQIILAGLEAGKFSLWQFFGARLRRIWPALLAMCSCVLAIGFARLSPPDYETNARHVLSSLTFLSNFDYLMRASYFDALAGSENWLLHTWSLSIEFQFYLIYPIILVALHRWCGRPGSLVQWVAGMFAVSYLLSALPTRIQPFPAFYVLPTRAWEMLGGALVCIAPQQLARWTPRRELLLTAGAALILLAVTAFSSAVKWPGRLAMVPVLGAILILLANDQQSWLARSRVLQFFGTTSYSIYLWHWPLIGLFSQFQLSPGTRVSAGVMASILIGWLSYKWIEVPGRRWLTKKNATGSAILGFLAVATLIFATTVASNHGLPDRAAMRDFSRLQQDVRYVHIDEGWCFVDNRTLNIPYRAELSQCNLGDLNGNKSALLWGDSHAGHFTPLVNELAKAAHFRLRVLGTPECWPTLQGEKLGINPQVCAHFRDDVARTAKDFDVIILAARWDSDSHAHWQEDVRYTLDALAATGKKIVVLRQVPLFETDIARQYIYDGLFGYSHRTHYARVLASDPQNAQVRELVNATPHAQFVDAVAGLCNPDGSACEVLQNGTMMYSDDQHLSVPGALILSQRLINAGQNFLP